AVTAPPAKVALGPVAGVTNSTSVPAKGHPPVSTTVTTSGAGRGSPTLATWPSPEVISNPASFPVQAGPPASPGTGMANCGVPARAAPPGPRTERAARPSHRAPRGRRQAGATTARLERGFISVLPSQMLHSAAVGAIRAARNAG